DEHFQAGRSLTQLAPFDDPVYGTHSRYLLARVYHLDKKTNQRENARLHYQGVVNTHAAQGKGKPKAKATHHVARAAFFPGGIQSEDSRPSEAKDLFSSFLADYPASSLAGEARLRLGFCQVQLRQFEPARVTLAPLEKDNLLADQALLWM